MTRGMEEILVAALRLLRTRGDGHLPALIRDELSEAIISDTPGFCSHRNRYTDRDDELRCSDCGAVYQGWSRNRPPMRGQGAALPPDDGGGR